MTDKDPFFDTSDGAMSKAASNSGGMLIQFIERVERLNEEIKGLQDDRKDVFQEAKGEGFDVKTLKRVIDLRKLEKDARDEQDALLEMYRSAVGI